MMLDTTKVSVFITVGDEKALGLNDNNELIVMTEYMNISLGKLTQSRIAFLKETLDRLSIHVGE